MSSAAEKSSHASASNPAILASTNEEYRSKSAIVNLVEDWLIVPKMLYFGLNVVIYSTHAFLYQYVNTVWGIEKDEYSLTNFVQFTNIAGAFVFSRLADRTGKYRLIVAGCVAAYCCCMCLLLFPVFLGDDRKVFKIAYYLTINAACFFFTAGTFPLLDSMVMSKLSSNPKLSKEMFGRQRLWGTIGHCIIGVIVHEAYEIFGNDYKIMFYTLIISSVAFIATVFFGIPANLKIEAHSHGHHGHGGSKDNKEASASPAASGPRPTAFSLMTSASFSFFLGTVLVAGFIRSIITTYQSPYITEELHYGKGVVSNSIFVRVFPEAALYFFSKEITQWLGIYWVLLIGHTAGVVRMFGYTLVPSGPVENSKPSTFAYFSILALECLKGVNSSLVISSAARIASDMAPKGLASTAQGLVAGTWQGLSMTIASLSGFFLVRYFQIRNTFVFCSTAGAFCIVLIVLKFAMVDRVIFSSSRKSVA
jgi:MFS family permease